MIPALLTSTSMAANVSTAKAASLVVCARSVTSVAEWTASPPVALIAVATAAAPSASTSATTTRPPRAATFSATSRPNPLAAPVTMTTFPLT